MKNLYTSGSKSKGKVLKPKDFDKAKKAVRRHTEFSMTTFKKNKNEIIDAVMGGILLVVLLGLILFIFSLLSV